MKRCVDIICSFMGLLMMSPVLLIAMLLIWLQDYHSPFYKAPRIGKDGKIFTMVKLRSMIVDADQTKVDSTASNDPRITWIGRIIRRYKVDELSQLWNVFIGDMSLVGPRPQVKRDVDLYTEKERQLLTILPGITDFSSIVFSDEGKILEGSKDPDLDYNRIIRPWKSRLGLLYVEKQSFFIDIILVILTAISIFSRSLALKGIQTVMQKIDADITLRNVSKRSEPLYPFPPPGSDKIVESRIPVL